MNALFVVFATACLQNCRVLIEARTTMPTTDNADDATTTRDDDDDDDDDDVPLKTDNKI